MRKPWQQMEVGARHVDRLSSTSDRTHRQPTELISTADPSSRFSLVTLSHSSQSDQTSSLLSRSTPHAAPVHMPAPLLATRPSPRRRPIQHQSQPWPLPALPISVPRLTTGNPKQVLRIGKRQVGTRFQDRWRAGAGRSGRGRETGRGRFVREVIR